MRKTKIICTLGPSTEKEHVLEQLFINGMNVARLNLSHGSRDKLKESIKTFQRVRDELNLEVALLLDTRGPEIRVKQFENGKVNLVSGEYFTLTTDEIAGTQKSVSITYAGLPKDINNGDGILIDDGAIELRVVNKNDTEIRCEIINGGEISDNKGVNVPGVSIRLPFVSDKDRQDIIFGLENDIDFVAASFVRNASDVKEIKKILIDNHGEHTKIIAKIENWDGVNNIDEIIRVADGVMVARGDMGVEIPFEELPSIQKMIISKCSLAGRIVITATQMLDSMVRNPRPTRAEITDVANAVYDGTSALMLSGETSVGQYPVEALLTMSKIAVNTEKDIDYVKRFNNEKISGTRNVTTAISHSTCDTAHTLGASAIISVTKSGHTAKVVSKYKPACSIIATTVTKKVARQLALSWGVYPILTEMRDTSSSVFDQAIDKASDTDLIKNGDLVVITGGMPAGVSGTTNTLRVHIVGDVLLEGKGVNSLIASGLLCVIREEDDLKHFNAGDVLVTKKTTDEVLLALKNAAAIITEEEAEDSKAAIVGKALEIPVLTNSIGATEILKSGTVGTVDARKGLVFSGIKRDSLMSPGYP